MAMSIIFCLSKVLVHAVWIIIDWLAFVNAILDTDHTRPLGVGGVNARGIAGNFGRQRSEKIVLQAN
jgi:hypothetical protein